MRERKFIRDVSEKFGAIDDKVLVDDPNKFLFEIVSKEAHKHPLRWERFRIWVMCSRVWRWVTSRT